MSRGAPRALALLAAGAFAALSLGGCLDFRKLLDECDAGAGLCAPDGSSGGGAGGGGGGAGGDGGDGGVVPDCMTDSAGNIDVAGQPRAFCYNGFTWVSPLPQGNELRAVWGSAPDDVWAGGVASTLMRFDGQVWSTWQSNYGQNDLEGTIEAIAGSDSDHVYLGGTGSTAAGSTLCTLSSGSWLPLSGGPTDPLYALAVSPDGGQLAVLTATAIQLFRNLGAGTPTRMPAVPPNALGRIGGLTFDTNDQCSALLHEVDGGDFCTLQRCDGTPLARVPTVDENCGALWSPAPGEVRFVVDTTLFRFDGGSAPAASGTLGEPGLAASMVSGGGGWVVGPNMSTFQLPSGPAPNVGVTSAQRNDMPFSAVWASPDAGSWAVGRGGALAVETPQHTFSWRTGGISWDIFALAVEADRVVVGGQHELFWAVGSLPEVPGASTVRDLWRDPDGGYYLAQTDGRVVHRTSGASRTPVAVFPSGEVHGIVGFGSDDIHAVGDNATVLSINAGGWTTTSLGTGWTLWKVHGRDGRAWAVGEQGTLAERPAPGQPWGMVKGPIAGDATHFGVWMGSADAGTGWIVGSAGTIRPVTNGQIGLAVATPVSYSLFDVWGFDEGDVWAVGYAGAVLHFTTAAGWVRVESGTRNQLERVRGRQYPDGSRELFIGGADGTVLRYRYLP